MGTLAAVFFGGAIGAVARYISLRHFQIETGLGLPLGVVLVNVSGSFAIGFLFYLFEAVGLPASVRMLVLVGFVGAYTTFSTYALETVQLLIGGEWLLALINFFVNNLLCFAAVALGLLSAKGIMMLAAPVK